MQTSVDLINRVSELVSTRKSLVTTLDRLQKKENELFLSCKIVHESLSILKTVGAVHQQDAVTTVESLVCMALKDVFGEEAYSFKMKIEETKRSMTVDFVFLRDGKEYEPLECCGYGQVDVAAFALRIAMMRLSPDCHLVLFDEPFKNVSEEYREKTAKLVMKISEALNLQFVIATHMKEFLRYGHKCFMFKKEGVQEYKP